MLLNFNGGMAVSARSILFTLFGDAFMQRPDSIPLACATALLQTLDIGPEAARAALSRTAREGWFQSERKGRQSFYQLTARGYERLMQARMRIYRQDDEPWDGGFTILGLTVPALAPSIRRRLIRELEFVGWAALASYQWATPLIRHEETMDILRRFDLVRFAWIMNGALATPDPASWAANLYPIRFLDQRYRDFIREWTQAPLDLSESESFRNRIFLVHAWRKFLFIDPGLPHALVPEDFSRTKARALFHYLYDQWYDPANAYIEHHLNEALLLS